MTAKLYYVTEYTFSNGKHKIVSDIYTNKKDADRELKNKNKNDVKLSKTIWGFEILANCFSLDWQWNDEHGRLNIEIAKNPDQYSAAECKRLHKEIDRKQRQSTAF